MAGGAPGARSRSAMRSSMDVGMCVRLFERVSE